MIQTLVKKGEYRDSVALMLIARELGRVPGVSDVSAVMGTPANKALLQQAGLSSPQVDAAGPNDLLIVVQAKDAASASAALLQAEQLLVRRAPSPGVGAAGLPGPQRPRSIRTAARLAPEASVAVISVPGEYAVAQAWDALHDGLHVLLFSDHVSLEDELALKEYAHARGLLMMGPGAGTAIINGVGLGFANAVPRGPIGIVAAAGTGLQEVSTLIARAGLGITQGIGVGGRDVGAAVGGMMLLQALEALQADPETRVIVVVSKLPSPAVTDKIVAQCERSDKPTVLALMGSPPRVPHARLSIAEDLRDAAAVAAALAKGKSVDAARRQLAHEDRALANRARALRRQLQPRQRYVRGLYSGGTLCEETLRLWQETLGPVWSNVPLDPRTKLPDPLKSRRHSAIDLGEEEYTVGRPHPMIDPSLRVRRLRQEANDPSVAAIVLDVVLGHGAHPDPAAELAPAIAEARQAAAQRNRELIVIASVTGTDRDPQGLARQTAALRKAGALVMGSNAAAAKLASALVL